MRKSRLVTVAVLSAAILSLAGCGPSAADPATPGNLATPAAQATPTSSATPADAGAPVAAVTAAFEAAMAGGLLEQLEFFACASGGTGSSEFIDLFGRLGELALATSGIDPDEFWAAFGTSHDDLNVVETSRSGDRAVVHLSAEVTVTPDVATLREMMRRNIEDRGEPVDDATIDAIVSGLVGQLPMAATIDQDVTVDRTDGEWLACVPSGEARVGTQRA
jgi:hypothetical protein